GFHDGVVFLYSCFCSYCSCADVLLCSCWGFGCKRDYVYAYIEISLIPFEKRERERGTNLRGDPLLLDLLERGDLDLDLEIEDDLDLDLDRDFDLDVIL